jgi:tetratricopeptide (TPR) repeat protein
MVKSTSSQPKQTRLSPEGFEEQVSTARELYNQGQLKEAAALLNAALKAAPRSFSSAEKGEVWELLGDLHAELAQWREAGIYYRRYLRFVKETKGRRTVVLKQVEVYWQENRFRQMLNLLEEMYQADPADWAVVLQLQAIYTALGWTELTESLGQALEKLAGADPERWRELAAHYLYLEAYPQAEEAAYQALGLRPGDASLCVLLAEIAQDQQDDELAVKWYRRALVLAPEEIGLYQELAYLYVRLEQEEGAQEMLTLGVQRALSLGAEEQAADLLVQQAALLVKQEVWEQARSLLCLALGLVPNHLTALHALAGLYQATASWSAAIEVIRDFLLPHPLVEKSYAQDWMGLIYLQTEQPEAALELFRGLLQADEQAVAVRYHLALAYKQAKKYRQAQQEVNRVLRHQPNHRGALTLASGTVEVAGFPESLEY